MNFMIPWVFFFKSINRSVNDEFWLMYFMDLEWSIFSSREIQYKNIFSLYNRARQTRSPEQTRQVLYTTVVLFLECLYTYVSSVDPQSFLGPSASHTPLVLMEKFENESLEEEPLWVALDILNAKKTLIQHIDHGVGAVG